MEIILSGFRSGQHQKDVLSNCKTYQVEPKRIYVEAKNMGYFTDWGIIELKPVKNASEYLVSVSIDSETWGWYGTAQIILFRDGQIIASDNFQSGVKGPVGNPIRYRSYPVLEI